MSTELMMMVFLPMAKRHRDTKVVHCPETDQPAEILVDNFPWYRFRKMGVRIRNCSLWPKRKGCTQSCLSPAVTAGSSKPEEEVSVIKIPLQITFKSMAPSAVIEAHIREAALKLDSFYGEIMGCRVLVEAPHQHHRKGKQYHVRIDLTVPGGELVIKRAPRLITDKPLRHQKTPDDVEQEESREPSKYAAHDDIQLAIRDAFDAARRKLQDYARRRRGVVKVHEGSPHARVSKLFPEEGFGFLETADGREIYFHENSVVDAGFGGLQLGTEVHFADEMGEKGPQATTVVPVTHHSR